MTTRREFLEYSGGLAIAFLAGKVFAQDKKKPPKAKTSDEALNESSAALSPNVFVHVAASGAVTLVCARSEMGQGVRSTIPALLADELGADMSRVTIVQADGDKKYGDQNTDGSSSIRNAYDDLRKAAATARQMLVTAAAQRWKVSPGDCVARDHAVFHGDKSLGFGELAEAAGRLEVPKPDDVKLRPRSELKRVFRDLPLVDGPAIATGKAMFGADIRVDGMLVAVIARPPVVGGRVARYDAAKALAVPGVKKVFEIPAPKPPWQFQPWGGVAVIADNTWAAMRGRAALNVEWESGPNGTFDSETYKKEMSASVHSPGASARNTGDIDAALAKAVKVVEAEYHVPHLAHVPMEPPACAARLREGKLEIWAPTQDPQTARDNAAKALGLKEEDVTVHVTFLGGLDRARGGRAGAAAMDARR